MFVELGQVFGRFLFRPELMQKGEEQARQLKAVFARFGVPEGGRVLDLCCGIGRHAIPLAELGYRVVGVDLSPVYLEEARSRAAQRGVADRVRFLLGDARELKAVLAGEGPFDAVLCLGTSIGYFGEEGDLKMLASAREVARDGALLVISTVNRDWIIANFQPTAVVTVGEWELHSFREMDLVSSRLKVRYRFCRREENTLAVVGEEETDLRLYSPHELWKLVARSGWRPIALHSDFELKSLELGSRAIVLLARAA